MERQEWSASAGEDAVAGDGLDLYFITNDFIKLISILTSPSFTSSSALLWYNRLHSPPHHLYVYARLLWYSDRFWPIRRRISFGL